ncbi:hypothetical protein BGP_2107 [Beggiatoa sp. PS]|nr:hypothetical protein BGP_2107 [Beggiatoa sp. PS]
MAQRLPKEVSVKTTALILSADDIDFNKVNQHFRIIKYYPRKNIFYQNTYYQQLHNLIKQQTDYPVYINKHHQALYLCVPANVIPPQLHDTTRVVMKKEVFDSSDPRDLHILLKVAIARFFLSDDLLKKKTRKVSKGSAKFLIATGKSSKEGKWHDVLEITPLHNWRQAERREFFLADKLTGLSEQGADYLRKIVTGKGNFDSQAFFKISGETTFEQFTPDKSVIKEMLAEGESVYALPTPKKKPNASDEEHASTDDKVFKKLPKREISFFQLGSERELGKSRCHILNEFCDTLVVHLQRVGINAKRKELKLRQIKTHPKQSKLKIVLPINDYVVYIVDERKNKSLPISNVVDYFALLLKQYFDKNNKKSKKSSKDDSQQLNLLNDNLLPKFQVIKKSQIKPGQRVLFIRDYCKKAFEPTNPFAPLKNEVDPYPEQASFLKRDISVQTININLNSEDFDNQSDKDYMDYQLPSLVAPTDKSDQDKKERESDLKKLYLKLFKSLNELHLKDVILHHDKVAKRLPCYQLMEGLVFVHEKKIMFNKGDNLVIKSWNDCDDVFLEKTGIPKTEFIQKLRAFRTYKNDPESKDKADEELKKGYSAIVSKEGIIEIINPNERALYDSFQALKRIQDRTGKKRVSEFKITSQVEPDMVDKVDKWNTFLSELPEDIDRVNYEMLVKKPSGSRKSHDGYTQLGIGENYKKEKSEWDAFVYSQLDLDLTNPKKGITDWYQGIWFDEENMQYIVGKRDGFPDKQEKAHELRSLVLHSNPECFDEKRFFALLDVTFINEGGYTVFPFPFKLIREWQKIQDAIA